MMTFLFWTFQIKSQVGSTKIRLTPFQSNTIVIECFKTNSCDVLDSQICFGYFIGFKVSVSDATENPSIDRYRLRLPDETIQMKMDRFMFQRRKIWAIDPVRILIKREIESKRDRMEREKENDLIEPMWAVPNFNYF